MKTVRLHGAYFNDSIEDEQYNTLMNHKRLERLKNSGMNPVDFVLQEITKQYGGSIALVTTNNVLHLEQNMKGFMSSY